MEDAVLLLFYLLIALFSYGIGWTIATLIELKQTGDFQDD